MKVEVLVATMDQLDHSLLKKMNIQSDAIITNQCNRNEVETIKYNTHDIRYYSFREKGVGLNRNNALMRAKGDISIFADDDLVYVDNYAEIIKKQFLENPTADVIIFNLIEEKPKRYIIKEKFNVGYLNYMRFGAARIAVKTRSITKNGIFFNLHFGGGTEHSAGEDVLFLTDCLKKKLNIIAVPVPIAYHIYQTHVNQLGLKVIQKSILKIKVFYIIKFQENGLIYYVCNFVLGKGKEKEKCCLVKTRVLLKH